MSGPDPEAGAHALVPLDDRAAWEAALAGVPHLPAHRFDHCRAFALSHRLPTVLYRYARDGHAAVCPLAVRTYRGRSDVTTPYGLAGMAAAGPIPGFAEAFRAFARASGWVAGYFQSSPLVFDPLAAEAGAAARGDTYLLDLAAGDAALRAGLSALRRRQLRRLEAEAVVVGPAEAGATADFLVREAPGFFAARDAAAVYGFDPATWRALAGAEGMLVLAARRGGETVAVALFERAGPVADYLFCISTPAGRDATTALVLDAARRLGAAGCRTLNLGGAVRDGDGVERFKISLGARPAPLAAVRLVFDEPAYRALSAAAGFAAPDATGYFPAYHDPRRQD